MAEKEEFKFLVFDSVLNNNFIDLVDQIYANTSECFKEEAESTCDYIDRILGYFHKEFTFNVKECEEKPDPKIAGFILSDVKMELAEDFEGGGGEKRKHASPKSITTSSWEYALLTTCNKGCETHSVAASCLINYLETIKVATKSTEKITYECEIHEVCVNSSYTGKGLCKTLIGNVVQHIANKLSDKKYTIKIYCMMKNKAACKCYGDVFENVFDNTDFENSAFKRAYLETRETRAKRRFWIKSLNQR
jgi:Acetyltransferase (GNAT) family